MKYVRALDGIRFFAVFMVALYHFHNFAAGWIGVQVFFVLSGFLITSILIDSKERHRDVYFRRFYWRRTLRIFPLYFTYLAIAALAYLLIRRPPELGSLWPYLLTYTSNFTRMGVYDRGGEFFVHFWSLAVEEQFYFVWPLVVLLLSRGALKRVVIGVLVGAPLLRLVMGVWLIGQGMDAERVARIVGVFTLTQFDAFAAGAAIVLFRAAEWPRPERLAIGGLAIWLAAGGLMLASAPLGRSGWSPDTLGHHSTMINYYHVWGNTLTNLVSAAVILAALGGAFRPIFENPIAVYVGRISYGVYVIHLPAHYVLEHSVTYVHSSLVGMVIFLVYFAAVVTLASLSYWAIEHRFLLLKDRMGGLRPGLPRPVGVA